VFIIFSNYERAMKKYLFNFATQDLVSVPILVNLALAPVKTGEFSEKGFYQL